MGLRTASVRRSQVVMAPALTETTQSQSFKLAPKDHFELATPINSFEPNTAYCLEKQEKYYERGDVENGKKKLNGLENGCGIFDCSDARKPLERSNSNNFKEASDSSRKESLTNIMNNRSPPMGDQDDKMGLQNIGLESVSILHKGKSVSNDVEHLINNLSSELPPGECSGGEIPTNDDIMQVITTNMNDEDFPISAGDLARDLATSLLSLEKQLLNEADMMNISMEDQQECCETVESIKESRSKDLIAEAKKKQVEVQRKLDFLRRRVLKLQSRLMGQHISGEVTGVFEHVHRSLKRLKDTTVQENMHSIEVTPTSGSSIPLPLADSNIDKLKPMSYGSAKVLIRKLETSTVIQANSAARQKQVPKYFGSGSIEPATFRTSVSGLVAIPPWSPEHKQELQKIAGTLKSELRILQSNVDSEATDSSSGGESCDEYQNYNNQHQQYLSIQKRALWKYSTDRAAIAARWTWLQVQISDLEYRIRQHTSLHRQVRATKGAVLLDGENPTSSSPPRVPFSPTALNGYRGQLPGASTSYAETNNPYMTAKTEDDVETESGALAPSECSRTRPLSDGFRKRKLLQTGGLHVISKKAARPSTIRCGCAVPAAHCALCTGRADPTHPHDPAEVLSAAEKIALLDPSFHPVFSMSDDVSESIHLEAIMKMPEWQQRSARMKSLKGYTKGERSDSTLLDHRSKKLEHRKKYGRLLKSSAMNALSAKLKNKLRGRKTSRHLNRLNRKRLSSSLRSSHHQSSNDGFDEELESISNNSGAASKSAGVSPRMSPLLQMQSISGLNRKNRISSYDIDNIVIPYSVAASTRVEKLQYKEILTPKWRIAEEASAKFENKNNGTIKEPEEDSDNEDLSEEAIVVRHDKCELDERKKFLSYLKLPMRSRPHKRTDSRAESSDTNTPDPMSPHPAENSDAPKEATSGSPLGSPPATPLSMQIDESLPIPSISVLRRRTMNRTGFAKDRGDATTTKEENRCSTPDHPEVHPYDTRTFPLDDVTYEVMVKDMPEDHLQMRTNVHAQDTPFDYDSNSGGYLDSKVCSPGSESTESALADEDPNDPEWIDVERTPRDRHKR
ncbi:hypothetical protein WA026_011484 [Henosepilachna vigintioctopunctata]|uniref:PEHE domain-containing protein n=1 Tax=Henosepilachna vigintioctopunctata TaxID=420089 RepID=A0AAW1TRX2_9CUCU